MPPCLSSGGHNESLAPTAGSANVCGQFVLAEVLEASNRQARTNDTFLLPDVPNPLPLNDPTRINN
eukprot:7874449-Lingulodinium_polyedra.AAC.1